MLPLEVQLNPGGWLAWIVVGIVAGAIASRVVQGRGLGCVTDLVVGVIGAFIGGFLVSFAVPDSTYGFLGTILVAVLGAIVLLTLIRLLTGGRRLPGQ